MYTCHPTSGHCWHLHRGFFGLFATRLQLADVCTVCLHYLALPSCVMHARRHAVFSYWIPQGLCSSFSPKSARSGQDAIMSARRIFSWLSETAIQKQHFSLSSEHVHMDPCCRSVVGDFGGCAAATSTRSIVSSLQYEIS